MESPQLLTEAVLAHALHRLVNAARGAKSRYTGDIQGGGTLDAAIKLDYAEAMQWLAVSVAGQQLST
jgi:hypothetical protein